MLIRGDRQPHFRSVVLDCELEKGAALGLTIGKIDQGFFLFSGECQGGAVLDTIERRVEAAKVGPFERLVGGVLGGELCRLFLWGQGVREQWLGRS